MSDLSKELVSAAETILLNKLNDIQRGLEELDQALQNETKSSAGDKYETSREMINQEQQKLSELQMKTKRMLDLLKHSEYRSTGEVKTGALVKTDKTYLHISIPLGKVETKNTSAFFISPTSPLAQALLGKKTGEDATFNGITHKILEVY